MVLAMKKKKEFSFTSAKDALQSTEPISVSDLSRELQVTEDKVLLLIQEGYLTLLKKHDTPFLCQVGRPAPAAMSWLKQALSPIPLVPVIPVSYVMQLLGIKTKAMTTLILEHGIEIYIDLVLGQMMTILAFHRLFNSIYPWHERARFDRQMFFSILSGIDLGGGEKFIRPKPYDQTLEDELIRVSKLPHPERALRGMDIYQAYKDAKTIASVLKWINKTPTQIRVDRIIRQWKHRKDKRYASSSSSSSSNSSAISVATSKASRSTVNPPSAAD